jgi:hypothetical protein
MAAMERMVSRISGSFRVSGFDSMYAAATTKMKLERLL